MYSVGNRVQSVSPTGNLKPQIASKQELLPDYEGQLKGEEGSLMYSPTDLRRQ